MKSSFFAAFVVVTMLFTACSDSETAPHVPEGSAGSSGDAGNDKEPPSPGAGTAGEGVGGDSAGAGADGAGAGAGGDGGGDEGGTPSDGGHAGQGHAGEPGEDSCAPNFEVLAAQTRWTAYVVEDAVGVQRLWAAKSGDVENAAEVFVAEGPISELNWSPDGRWLAFVDEAGSFHTNLYVVDFGGDEPDEAALVGGDLDEVAGRPRWSPDSSNLVYAGVNGATTEGLRLVNVETGLPSEPISFAEFSCPQGAYSDLPCVSLALPLLLEWSPDGSHLAILASSLFYLDFGTGSASDLFLLSLDAVNAPEVMGRLASPFVPSFGTAARGVVPESFQWSPDGTKVAFTGSFEDTTSVSEVYVFDLDAEDAVPVKVHDDLGPPNSGARGPIVWASSANIVFESDPNEAGRFELLSVDVSNVEAAEFPNVRSLLNPSDTVLRATRLSPDRSSLFSVTQSPNSPLGTLTLYTFDGEALSDARVVSQELDDLGTAFDGSVEWGPNSDGFAIVEAGAGNTMALSLAGLDIDEELCQFATFGSEAPLNDWEWLSGETSVVVRTPDGVHRIHSAGDAAEPLLGSLVEGATLRLVSFQPREVP